MFLYFASQAVHDPFSDCSAYSVYDGGIPSDEYLDADMYTRVSHSPKLTYPPNFLDCATLIFSFPLFNQITNTVVGQKRQQYAMSLVLLDNAVKEIYQALEETKQLQNTYIIFASDNGACLYGGGKNAPLRGSKGTLFEGNLIYTRTACFTAHYAANAVRVGGMRVDAFIHSPLLPASTVGTVYSGLMHVSDWFPTILDLAGITTFASSSDYSLDGVSQVT